MFGAQRSVFGFAAPEAFINPPNLVYQRNFKALKRVIAILMVYAGLADDTRDATKALDQGKPETAPSAALARALRELAAPWTISRRVRGKLSKLLLPAESALRRLIVILASEIPWPKLPARQTVQQDDSAEPDAAPAQNPAGQQTAPACDAASAGEGVPCFPAFALVDQQPHVPLDFRRQSVPPLDPSVFKVDLVRAAEQVGYTPFLRRMAALIAAFEDMPAQARRYALWQSRRDRASAEGQRGVHDAIRTGHPPGCKARSVDPLVRKPNSMREIDRILIDCNSTAHYANRLRYDSS